MNVDVIKMCALSSRRMTTNKFLLLFLILSVWPPVTENTNRLATEIHVITSHASNHQEAAEFCEATYGGSLIDSNDVNLLYNDVNARQFRNKIHNDVNLFWMKESFVTWASRNRSTRIRGPSLRAHSWQNCANSGRWRKLAPRHITPRQMAWWRETIDCWATV